MKAKQDLDGLTTLQNDWKLQCNFNDLCFKVSVFKLDSKQVYCNQFETIPQQFKFFIDSFAQLKQMLSSKEVKFEDSKLKIRCQFGTKTKDIEINLQQKQLSFQKQICNIKILNAQNISKYKQQIKQDKKTIINLHQTIRKQQKRISELQNLYKGQQQKLKQLQNDINKFNEKYVNCTKWGCQVAIAKKNVKYHQMGRSGIICGNECQY